MLGSFKIVAFCVFTCIVVKLNVVISVNIYLKRYFSFSSPTYDFFLDDSEL